MALSQAKARGAMSTTTSSAHFDGNLDKAPFLWVWLVPILLKSDIVTVESGMAWGVRALGQTPWVQVKVLFLFGFVTKTIAPQEREIHTQVRPPARGMARVTEISEVEESGQGILAGASVRELHEGERPGLVLKDGEGRNGTSWTTQCEPHL